ncbi:hypothetical protein D7D52_30185 [Nocardia yunnanensis]|uniref:Uncharacterized protein n=1 Tax=Nocardia yunnanensis TaxID=2382165 RepID=A0A386ZJE0_9NOCA|nr:hypothetical protein D7D52_30185 [Nocardia yunnanensis]
MAIPAGAAHRAWPALQILGGSPCPRATFAHGPLPDARCPAPAARCPMPAARSARIVQSCSTPRSTHRTVCGRVTGSSRVSVVKSWVAPGATTTSVRVRSRSADSGVMKLITTRYRCSITSRLLTTAVACQPAAVPAQPVTNALRCISPLSAASVCARFARAGSRWPACAQPVSSVTPPAMTPTSPRPGVIMPLPFHRALPPPQPCCG